MRAFAHGGVIVFATGFDASGSKAWVNATCGHCGRATAAAVIGYTEDENVHWLRCTGCGMGLVSNYAEVPFAQADAGAVHVLSPSALVGEPVEGLPPEARAAYREARASASAGAYTATELVCRKLLMHVAVDKGAKGNLRFVEYLDYLKSEGYVTRPMAPWVTRIKDHGNEATHELPSTDEARALDTLSFTTQLLRSIYEMEFKMRQPEAPASDTSA